MTFNSEYFNKIENVEDKFMYIKKSENIKWEEIDLKENMSEEFISEYIDKLNIVKISSYKYLSEEFMTEHKDLLDWRILTITQKLNNDFILLNMDVITDDMISVMSFTVFLSMEVLTKYVHNSLYVNWYNISEFQKLSEEFIEKHINELELTFLCTNQKLSEEFIRKYVKKNDLNLIFKYQKLSEEFIKELIKSNNVYNSGYYKVKLIWGNIFRYQKLSEGFIEKYKLFSLENINSICEYQKLSESYMRRNIEILKWEEISKHQKLSEEFIEENIDKMNMIFLIENQDLSEEFTNKFSKIISNYKNMKVKYLSENFLKENIDRLDKKYLMTERKLSNEFHEWYLKNEIYEMEFDKHHIKTSIKINKYKMYELVSNQCLSIKFIKKNIKNIDFSDLINNINIKEEVFEKYKNKINLLEIGGTERKMEKITEDDDTLYLKYYRIFNGDEKYLESKRVKKSERVKKVLSYFQERKESFISERYRDKNYKEVTYIIKEIVKKEKLIKERLLKNKKKQIRKEINLFDNEIVF